MHFMVMRRAGAHNNAGAAPPSAMAIELAAGALRLLRSDGRWRQLDGPFPASELVDGFTLIEAGSTQAAIELVQRWPCDDADAVFEIRVAGCAGGCVGFDERGTAAGTLPRRAAQLTRYVVFIRSDRHAEADLAPPAQVIDVMNQHNEAGVQAGVLLAGEGLRGSASGARIHLSRTRSTVVDGPFTEVKELIAGYWMLQAASRQQAIAWLKNYPYPGSGEVTLELREVREQAAAQSLTPALLQAEQRMRAQLLEAGLRDACGKIGGR